MKKVPHQTSRVNWQMGQALLPEHFRAQEQSIREELWLRFRASGVPGWGLASLQWDAFQILNGIISVQELTLFLPSGVVVDVPGNTGPAFVNLNTSGATTATVYLHFQSGHDVVSFGEGDLAEEGIERIVHRIELSTEASSSTAAHSFKLAVFEAGPNKDWSLKSSYVPPLLQVGTSPFFESFLERCRGISRSVRQVLDDEIQNNYLAAENQASAKAALRGLFHFQGMLADINGGVSHHPYELYRALRALSVDIAIFRGFDPEESERPYDHEDLATCFEAVLTALETQTLKGGKRTPYVEFRRRERMLVCDLTAEAKRAKDFFLLVQKPQVSTKTDLVRIKLASEKRLHTVHEHALRGIPIQRLDNPPFARGISANVEFFAIASGEEWDHAIREGRVVLFDGPQLEGLRLYLYWRAE